MITSKSNQLIKLTRSLKDKSARDELELFVVEGIKSVAEALNSLLSVKKIIFTEKGYQSFVQFFGEFDALYELVTDDVFKYISEEKTPQGVLALVCKPQNTLIKPTGSCLFLDGLQDPSNVGAIIRTAAATGFCDIYLAECVDPFNSKSVRASMGGIFKTRLYIGDREQLLSFIDKPIVIADMAGENVFCYEDSDRVCLVIGNEGSGVSDRLKSLATKTVSIPMQNNVESLNAAVSASILMYALKKENFNKL